MVIKEFLESVIKTYNTGKATEHSYRPAIITLINSLSDDINAINEPKRIECGAPDFIVSLKDIAIGHIEAKDIDIDLRKMNSTNEKQKTRYRLALNNLIYTNCLDWDFYRDGQLIASVSIADFLLGIQPNTNQFDILLNLLKDFIKQRPKTITSPPALAKIMADKAILIKDILSNALIKDIGKSTDLENQYIAFKEHLIHDIKVEEFADIYSETIAYGMFAARLHDESLESFSRYEALELLPKSNPFLRSLFGYIAGPDLDDRIKWIIDDLATIFLVCDVKKLMEGFGSLTERKDPFLHFYEDFLTEYSPKTRKARGVWYTPEPVVNFIVRAVDCVLKNDFSIKNGLADTSKTIIDWDTGQYNKNGKPITIKKDVHRIQVLDPATGTGTFLAEVIKQVAPTIKSLAESAWSKYIEKDLICRLHGFELLMASYAMCHMKLDMILTELGYKPTNQTPPRLSVYLTNSLEEGEAANQSLPFAQWLSNEVKEANTVKRDLPIMCVIGNPPYSGESSNKGDWIMGLMDDYKKEPGGLVKLKERNPKWINDDYVKFMRFAEQMIDKNNKGILGFITNNGYLSNPTFRGVRWHLLKTFNKIYILDLHGNSKKKEKTPNGAQDRNVFDIQQGVAIIIATKTEKTVKGDKRKRGKDIPLADVFHYELWGDRKYKYNKLWEESLSSIEWNKLNIDQKYFMFYPVNHHILETYDKGISINELMPANQKGITTSRDNLAISFSREDAEEKLRNLRDEEIDDASIRRLYFNSKFKKGDLNAGDTKSWKLTECRYSLRHEEENDLVKDVSYRPFDNRSIIYSEHILERSRKDIMTHLIDRKNICLSFNRSVEEDRPFSDAFVFDRPIQLHSLSIKESNNIAPLYLYLSDDITDQSRSINLDPQLWDKLVKNAADKNYGTPNEIDTFDYIYGVLYCPTYREKYHEFLKIDFPRIPIPATADEFWNISKKGKYLRKLHLMEDSLIDEIKDIDCKFTGEGSNIIDKIEFNEENIWINNSQYFSNVSRTTWDFYIGGYQPVQKWLADRKGKDLSFNDILHYIKIVKIVDKTKRTMNTIDIKL